MNVTFACPSCQQTARAEFRQDPEGSLLCPHCNARIRPPEGAYQAGVLHQCLVCPSRDLYVRKDFPQRLGVAIVILGFAASCVAWYYYAIYWTFGILFATALIDLVLYMAMGESLTCYRCHAEYRDLPASGPYAPFDLVVQERHRQEAARRSAAGIISPSKATPLAE